MKGSFLLNLVLFFTAFANGTPNCETHTTTFALPNTSPKICRNLKLLGTHSLKICDNRKGTLKITDDQIYFLFSDKNLWKFKEEEQDFSTQKIETLSMDLEKKSFTHVTEKKNHNGTVLSQTVCDGLLEFKN